MRLIRQSIIAIWFFILFLAVPCQSSEFQTWSDFATIKQLTDRWQYNGDYGIRGVLSDNDFTLVYLRPSVSYRFKPDFTIHGGIRFFRQWNDNSADIFEIGPWQGLRYAWPKIRGYTFTHYARLEQRMIWETEDDYEYEFTLRPRYQLSFRTPRYTFLLPQPFFLSVSTELFWKMNDSLSTSFVNRVRYDFGIGTSFTERWRVQLHWISQDAIKEGDPTFANPFDAEEHILRLRLSYQFD